MVATRLRVDLVNQLKEMVRMEHKVQFQDDQIMMTIRPDDDTLEKLMIKILHKAGRPLYWKEIKAIFENVAGEDRLRRVLRKLKSEGHIVELAAWRYVMPEHMRFWNLRKIKNPIAYSKFVQEGSSCNFQK